MDLKPYPTRINGTDTVLLLTAEDAKARGLTAAAEAPVVERKQAARPRNKAATADSDKD